MDREPVRKQVRNCQINGRVKHDMKMIIPHVHNSRTENRFENRFAIVILPMEDLKRFMFCHSSQNENTLLLYRFKKIRQNLMRKETYVGSSKAAAVVLEAWVHDTLRDLNGLFVHFNN